MSTSRRAQSTPLHILLVDSNRLFLRTLERTLYCDQYLIRTAPSVLDALTEISRHSIDLVISETHFPGLTGFDLVRRLREDSRTRELPVILVTDRCDDSAVDKFRKLGVAGLLLKPVRPQIVRQRVRTVLENTARFDRSEKRPTATAHGDGVLDSTSSVENTRSGLQKKLSARYRKTPQPAMGESIAKLLKSSARIERKKKRVTPLADPRMRTVRVPIFRTAAQKILSQLSNPDSTIRQIAQLVETDPGLSTSVLKAVNSAYYGLKSSVGSVTDACALLGLRDIGSICLGATISDSLLAREDRLSRSCWNHCLATSFAAREIGARVELPRSTDPGVAGLLSGVGILATVLSPQIDHFEINDIVAEKTVSWAAAEREVLGFDHAELGGAIVRQWGLPTWIGRVIEESEDPARVGRPDEWVVAVASFAVQSERSGESFPRHLQPEVALKELAVVRPHLWAQVEDALPSICKSAWEQPDLATTAC